MSLSESTYFNSGMTFKRAQASNTLSIKLLQIITTRLYVVR